MKKIAMIVAVAGLAGGALAQNTGGSLTAGTATYRIGGSGTPTLATSGTTTGTGPAMDLFLSGTTTDQIFSDWWWFRSGADTREFAIANATSRVFNTSDATYGYNLSNGLTGTLRYDLSQPVANSALITQTWVINNPGASAVSLSMFHYFDTNLNGGDPTDAATLTNPNNRMTISDTGATTDYWGLGANNYQVATWPAVRNVLTNTAVDSFNNTGLPYSSTDFSGGYQWNLEVPAGGAVTIVLSYGVNTAAVPAPGAAALLGLGGLLAARRRRA